MRPFLIALLLLCIPAAGCLGSAPEATPASEPPKRAPDVPRIKWFNGSTELAFTNPGYLAYVGDMFGVRPRPTDCVVVHVTALGDPVLLANRTPGSFTFQWEPQSTTVERFDVEVFTGQVSWGGGERDPVAQGPVEPGGTLSFGRSVIQPYDHEREQDAVYLYAWLRAPPNAAAFEETITVSYAVPMEESAPLEASASFCDEDYLPVPR